MARTPKQPDPNRAGTNSAKREAAGKRDGPEAPQLEAQPAVAPVGDPVGDNSYNEPDPASLAAEGVREEGTTVDGTILSEASTPGAETLPPHARSEATTSGGLADSERPLHDHSAPSSPERGSPERGSPERAGAPIGTIIGVILLIIALYLIIRYVF